MQVLLAVAVIFLGIFNSPVAAADGCKDPSAVEAFAASYYTAMIVVHDPNIINNLSLDGGEAGMKLYKVVKACLEAHQQCNAESVAYTAGQAVSLSGTLTLPGYFNHAAYTVGRSLLKNGILDCSNAVSLALEWLGHGKKEIQGLSEKNFETYMHGIVYGLVDLLLAHGLSLEHTAQMTADLFYDSYEDEQPHCTFDKSSN